MIEVEIRGPLSKKQFNILKRFLEKNGRIERKINQSTIFFKNLGDKDLRLRWDNNGNTILVIKGEKSNQFARKEVELKLLPYSWKQALKFLIVLGFNKGQIGRMQRFDYRYKTFKIALRRKTVIGDHFEIEIIVRSKKEINKTIKKLKDFAKKLQLQIWSEQEYRKVLRENWSKIAVTDLSKLINN